MIDPMDGCLEKVGAPERDWLAGLFRRRAAALAERRDEDGDAGSGDWLLCVRVGRERYALALHQLEDMIPAGRVAPVPGWPPEFIGVVNRRGEIRPVADLGRLLDPAAPAGENGFFLFPRGIAHGTGLRIDEAGELLRLERARFGQLGDRPAASPAVLGIDPDGLILLDPVRLPFAIRRGGATA